MKKALITTIALFASLIGLRADAVTVIMDYQGDTFVRPNSIERNLTMNSDDANPYDIAIRPLEDALVRSDGEVRIPLEYVFLNNSHEDVYMRYNEYSTIFRRAEMGGLAKNMTFKVRGYGMVPAGVYNLNIEIQATDPYALTVEGTSTFNLQIIVPTTQELSFRGATANINITPNNAFVKGRKITNETNPILYIDSNCDWVLTLDTANFDDSAGNYYIRTISASPNINERLQERVLLTQGKDIIIAKGKAPANNEYITIECSVEGKDGDVIKAGNYLNRLKFKLSEDRGF